MSLSRIPLALCVLTAFAAEDFQEFETKVRPVLAKCQSCHGPKMEHSGLRLDSRAAALKGGVRGPALKPGDPDASMLIRAVRHDGLKMPPGARLPASQVDALERWVAAGAPWPGDVPTPVSKSVVDRAREHWAFQPVRKPPVPALRDQGWPSNDIDRFLLAKLEAAGLRPADPADSRTLLRRLTFDLTGLPPTAAEADAFAADSSPEAYARAVERLLASRRFGEHWARHWMDLVRYAESHGSQGDFELPMAWRYRDYLIRAFNADVPYDQFVREHIAGDLLPEPRINKEEAINESILGSGNMRMVEFGFVPVDALDDQVKVVENQIDVFSKAFQGLTIACARCHDHKFDPVTQRDFHALYGVFASSRPGQVTIDLPQFTGVNRSELADLRRRIRTALAETWRTAPLRLPSARPKDPDPPKKPAPAAAGNLEAVKQPDALAPWFALKDLPRESLAAKWKALQARWGPEAVRERRQRNAAISGKRWKLTGPDLKEWFKHGAGAADLQSSPAGEFHLASSGGQVVSGVYPAGVYSGLLSRKYSAVLQSPRFLVETDSISIRALGGNVAWARLVVENYAIGNGGIYPAANLSGNRMGWVRLDTAYRKGSHAYIECVTFDDRARAFGQAPADIQRNTPPEDHRSHFGAVEVLFHNGKEPPEEEALATAAVLEGDAPASAEELAERYARLAREAAAAWRDGALTDIQAALLNDLAAAGAIPNTLAKLPAIAPLVAEFRKLEEQVPVPRRAPGMLTGTGFDQPLFARGDHTNPGEPVERRYLEALGSRPWRTQGSGRLELAAEVASPSNPLTARVIVNRLWRHLFGRGIVATVDNFGRMGRPPTHPELLDYLAARLVDNGWSLKRTIAEIVMSRAYRMSSAASEAAMAKDPANTLWQHAQVRRLGAEAIRDSILAVSGELDTAMYGPSIPLYYTGKTEGGGKVGPLDGARRRSVYQKIKRNAQNPLLEAFDAPKPSSTRGERDATNVPAQSLTLMNDPFVIEQAAKWGARVSDSGGTDEQKIDGMFRRALARPAGAAEMRESLRYVRDLRADHGESSAKVWADFAQSMFNLKEFVYPR